MWSIDKSFSFCYGHRVWSQQLLAAYCESGDYQCKCRHLHGHEGLAHVYLQSDHLERGMVTDFKHLGWLKNFLDTYLDHRFIVDSSDPLFDQLVDAPWKTLRSDTLLLKPVFVPGTTMIAGQVPDLMALESFAKEPEYEALEGFLVVDFLPTSENLAKWLYDCVREKMQMININVTKVEWNETPKSRSTYGG